MASKPVMVVGTSAAHRRALAARHFSDTYILLYVSPDIDEKQVRGDDAATLTRRVAEAKMQAVLAQLRHRCTDNDKDAHVPVGTETAAATTAATPATSSWPPGSVVVTFDQVVVWRGQVREKPSSVDENVRFLRDYSGSTVGTVQTTVLHRLDTHAQGSKVNTTSVQYRPFDDAQLPERVVARGASLHAAGGYVIEDVDLLAHMTSVDPPDGREEVQGFSARTIRDLLASV